MFCKQQCPRENNNFGFSKEQSFLFTSEKKIFKNLKIVQVDTHEGVLKEWLKKLNLLKGDKYTLIHVDSRILIFFNFI